MESPEAIVSLNGRCRGLLASVPPLELLQVCGFEAALEVDAGAPGDFFVTAFPCGARDWRPWREKMKKPLKNSLTGGGG
jgi:hypothetical protein